MILYKSTVKSKKCDKDFQDPEFHANSGMFNLTEMFCLVPPNNVFKYILIMDFVSKQYSKNENFAGRSGGLKAILKQV